MTQTLLAFDFGTVNIGVAYGQTLTATARELPSVRARDGVPDWGHIEKVLSEWQPDLVVVGLPLNMDDSESELAARARKFGNRLHGRFGVKVLMWDERLSTREAKSEARQRGHKGHYKSDPVDSIAARLILESWLQSNTTASHQH